MAFKILTQDEIDVLSERERKIYEQAYHEYQERAAFVEKLEKLDKVKMPEVSIKMKGVRRIEAPKMSAIKRNGFKADTTASVDLLNVTRKVRGTFEKSLRPRPIQNYRAVLPGVRIAVPDKVKALEDKPFIIENVPAVPRAVPTQVKYDNKDYRAKLPELNNFQKPETGSIVIKDYSVEALPDVRTAKPSVPAVDIQAYNAVLPELTAIKKPEVRNITIENYSVSELPQVNTAAPDAVNVKIGEYKA